MPQQVECTVTDLHRPSYSEKSMFKLNLTKVKVRQSTTLQGSRLTFYIGGTGWPNFFIQVH